MNQTTAKSAGAAGQGEKIHALTSLRFFAALFVVLYHITWSFLPWVAQEEILAKFIRLGYVSVSFFFLLSGYILGVVYLRRGGPVAARAFWKARFARVYPLFFLTLVLDTPFLFMSRLSAYGLHSALLKTGATFAANCVMLQAWVLQLRGIDNPNWSLSVETLFYLSFPFIGVALWKLRGARLWLAAAMLYLGGQGLVLLAARRIPGDATEFNPLLHLTTFALGILLARWQMLRRERRATLGIAERIGAGHAVAVLLAALGFAAAVYWSPGYSTSYLCDGLLAPVFACVIWAFSHSDWAPARVLSAPWLVVLGEASFGLYLFHLPVFHLFERLGWDRTVALLPVYLAVSIGLSLVSFYWYETPMRRWILKRRPTHVKESLEMASDAQ